MSQATGHSGGTPAMHPTNVSALTAGRPAEDPFAEQSDVLLETGLHVNVAKVVMRWRQPLDLCTSQHLIFGYCNSATGSSLMQNQLDRYGVGICFPVPRPSKWMMRTHLHG